jgi:hypothetical protein
VESWLRRLPLAKSSCAKIRNILSVLFNHACRQGAKRRTTPSVLAPPEIKALINNLGLRERTLVLVVASTGLRQSELFGLKWGDINFARRTMSVTRSIVCGVVGPCKTESSQNLCRFIQLFWKHSRNGKKPPSTSEPTTGFSRAGGTEVGNPSGCHDGRSRENGSIQRKWVQKRVHKCTLLHPRWFQ